MYKLSIITGFLGKVANRFLQYQENVSFEEKLKLAESIEGLDGLELCYPADFSDPKATISLMKNSRLGISSINFRSRRNEKWLRGSFSSELSEERSDAVADFKRVVDIAAELGCDKVTTCTLNEGSDYLFEMDYASAYGKMAESLREVARHNRNINICIEYKLSDPRVRCLLGTAGETVAFCDQIGEDNIGLTLDIGHALYANERPAQSLVLSERSKRLFHVHLNDNDKQWDWDMLPGAYNLWDFIEFLYYLNRSEYSGWIAYDIFPKEQDKKETFDTAIGITKKLMKMTENIKEEEVSELFAQRNPNKSLAFLFSLI